MNQFQYIIFLLATYAGLLAGVVISHMTKEELTPGKKYFYAIKAIIFTIIIYNFSYYMLKDIVLSSVISFFGGLLSYFLERWFKVINADIFFYSFFAVIVYETRNSEYSAIIGSLVFLFGLVSASVKSEGIKSERLFIKIKDILPENIIYLIMGLLLSFVFKT